MSVPVNPFALRDLPLAPRLVIAAFLVVTGVGYGSALVQLHFRDAAPGDALPGRPELERTYFGYRDKPVSRIERLLEADEGPFNGAGTMRPAFTDESDGWRTLTDSRTPEQMDRLRAEREGERRALLHWVRSGANRDAYERDDYPIGTDLADREITASFLVKDADTHAPLTPRRVRIRKLVTTRCATCHAEDGRRERARFFPLDTYDRVQAYCRVRIGHTHTLSQLAQTTHVHLLGFAALFGMVGLVFSFTSYPGWVRVVIGPFPLVVQALNIGCWWLARQDPAFSRAILGTGVLIALVLGFQIVGCLFDLFGRLGKLVLIVLLLASCVAMWMAWERIIGPHLDRERIESLANP